MSNLEQKPDIQAFLTLYAKFQSGVAWLAKREAEGLDNRAHLADFRQIEAQADQAWDNLSDEQKDATLPFLGVPGEVLAAKKQFSGKLVSIT